MKANILACLAAGLMAAACAASSFDAAPNKEPAIAKDPRIEKRIRKTLSGMTIEEKAGQMMEITLVKLCRPDYTIDPEKLQYIVGEKKIGSILNVSDGARAPQDYAAYISQIQEVSMKEIGIPCVYGLDQIHGASYYIGGTLFPQEINIAASFNVENARAMGRILAYETRAGLVPWVYSPVMDLTREPAWPRNWESFGEDPYLQSVMASAEVRAIQGDDPNHIDLNHCAVSIKHYMGYGAPKSGHDRTPAIICESDLRDKFFAPFKACAEAGALTAMVNSASINGIPTHANRRLLQGWLKDGLNWDGMLVTDWADIRNLYERDHVAANAKEAVAMGINAGIDMIMDPIDPSTVDIIVELAKEGGIPMSRIDDAVSRVLRLKYRLGLFEHPTWDTSAYAEFGSDAFVAAARKAALESEVLLKNDGVLPLKKDRKILICGPNANSVRTLNGGWSYLWQGTDDPKYVAGQKTILDAMRDKFGEKNVSYAPGVSYVPGEDWEADVYDRLDETLAKARHADYIVVCVGENSYCETPGNINDLNISARQFDLVEKLSATGKPVVMVLNEGRTRIIGSLVAKANAIVDIMLPGNYGGVALSELLAGDANFSAKLPMTYQAQTNSLSTYDYKTSEVRETMPGMYNYDAKVAVQWPFGFGLSYTTFEYSNLKVDKAEFCADDVLTVTVDVTNTGAVAGSEPVLAFVSDIVASEQMPDVKRLRAFAKVDLEPGQTRTVSMTIPASDLAYVNACGRWILEKGDFTLNVGGQTAGLYCAQTKRWKTQNR